MIVWWLWPPGRAGSAAGDRSTTVAPRCRGIHAGISRLATFPPAPALPRALLAAGLALPHAAFSATCRGAHAACNGLCRLCLLPCCCPRCLLLLCCCPRCLLPSPPSPLPAAIAVLPAACCRLQEVGWYDEDRNSSGVLASKLSSDALAVKGQFGDTMGLLTQVRPPACPPARPPARQRPSARMPGPPGSACMHARLGGGVVRSGPGTSFPARLRSGGWDLAWR